MDDTYFRPTNDDPDFIWEFKLDKLPEDRENGWPDLAFVWDKRILIFELKTEAGSHRDGQIDWYMRLALNKYPQHAIDLVYLTVDPIEAAPQSVPEGARYHNLLWTQMADLIDMVWAKGIDLESSNARVFAEYLREMSMSARLPTPPLTKELPSKDAFAAKIPVDELPNGLLERCRSLAAEVVGDGHQRALDWMINSPEVAKNLKRALTAHFSMEPEESPLRMVTLWVWQPSSSGRPLSPGGREHDVELRLSRKKTQSQ